MYFLFHRQPPNPLICHFKNKSQNVRNCSRKRMTFNLYVEMFSTQKIVRISFCEVQDRHVFSCAIFEIKDTKLLLLRKDEQRANPSAF